MPIQVPLFFMFAAMLMIPSYPYLVAGFFICNAVFYSFAMATGENDILFSVLLPVSKKGIVRGKISFVICIQLIAILLFTGMTFVNHLMFKGAGNNGGTDASLTLIAGYFLLYSIFNAAFIPGYYKAPHKFGKQFLKALIAVFAFLFAFEGVMIASGAVEESVPVLGFIKTNLDAFPASPTQDNTPFRSSPR